MPKTVTLRLSDAQYNMISAMAEREHRPISNYITAHVLEDIENACFVDDIEMAQIMNDANLHNRLKAGHADADKMKGKFVG